MNNNERFALTVISIGCLFGIAIIFIPLEKASSYSSLPTSLISSAVTYLGIKKNES